MEAFQSPKLGMLSAHKILFGLYQQSLGFFLPSCFSGKSPNRWLLIKNSLIETRISIPGFYLLVSYHKSSMKSDSNAIWRTVTAGSASEALAVISSFSEYLRDNSPVSVTLQQQRKTQEARKTGPQSMCMFFLTCYFKDSVRKACTPENILFS